MVELSAEQLSIVQYLIHGTDNILINAIAGSGKTFTLVELARVAVDVLHIPAEQIIFITLTSAAAENMRIKFCHSHKYADTSHSLAATILSEFGIMSETSSLYNCDVALLQFYEWLKAKPPAAQRFMNSVKLVCVDEMQDCNELLINILLQLKEKSRIVAVGDDNQSIYGFQGSSVEWIRKFPQMFHPCKSFSLSISFRCSTPILAVANAVIDNGRVEEYIPKPRGRSVEELQWEESKVPVQLRKSVARKPKLLPCHNTFHAMELACEDIRRVLEAPDSTVQPHDICVQARSNVVLYRTKALLLKMGISCKLLRDGIRYDKIRKRQKQIEAEAMEPGSVFDDDDESCLKDHVALGTPYVTKGLEFKEGYIVSLHAAYWPDVRESDLDSERRGLYVALTRYMDMVTVYNCESESSIFINELARKGMLASLFDTRLLSFAGCDDDGEDLGPAEQGKVLIAINKKNEMDVIAGIDSWVANMNGCAYRRLGRELLPDPLPLTTRPVPLLYNLPDPNPKDEPEQPPKRIRLDQPVVPDGLLEDSEEDDDESDDEKVIEVDEEEEQAEEDVKPYNHSKYVIEHHMEQELELFLDCFTLRYLQQLQLQYNGNQQIQSYSYQPANKSYTEMKKRNIDLSDNRLRSLYFYRSEYSNTGYTWSRALFAIYWTSSFATFKTGNLGMMYIPMSKARLMEYNAMLEEMERIIHYLIYGQTYHSDTGYTQPGWSFHDFYHVKCSKIPLPYILIGKRLIVINNGTTEFGVSFEALLKTLAYACVQRIVHKNKIESVEVYHTFARRLCRLDISDWKEQKEYMTFLQKADRRVFDL